MNFRLLTAAQLVLLAGCTTALETGRPADGIAKGYAYQLPRVGYDVDITRILTHCPDADDPALRFDTSAKAASRNVSGETIVINYLRLANGFKTSDMVFKSHPNGMLQSVNLTVNDHTADIIKEGVKSVVGIGKIAIGLPGGGLTAAVDGGAPPPPYLRCRKAIRDVLESVPKQKAKAEAAERDAKKAAKALTDFNTSHPETPRSAQVAAQTSKLIAASRAADAALDDAKQAVAKSQATLTLVARHSLELDGKDAALSPLAAAQDGKTKPSDMLEIDVLATDRREIVIPLDRQLEPDFDNATNSGWGAGETGRSAARAVGLLRIGAGKAAIEKALANLPQMDVQIVAAPLTPQAAGMALPASETCATDRSDCGVIYRTPAPGRLRVCWRPGGRDVTSDECFRSIPTENFVLFAEDRNIPQFGRLASLPFRNGSFSNNSLSAEFAEDGRIVTASYKKPTAEVQSALASVNEGVGGLTDLITYANGAKLRKLQEQKAINEAILGEQESRAKLSPTEVEALTQQTAVINAQLDLAAAQTRAQPSQVTEIDNERLLIEAQIKRAQKLIELRKLESELATQPSEPQGIPE